jgi:hypothetical protein
LPLGEYRMISEYRVIADEVPIEGFFRVRLRAGVLRVIHPRHSMDLPFNLVIETEKRSCGASPGLRRKCI